LFYIQRSYYRLRRPRKKGCWGTVLADSSKDDTTAW
jgi:hypothetical protein